MDVCDKTAVVCGVLEETNLIERLDSFLFDIKETVARSISTGQNSHQAENPQTPPNKDVND